MSSSERLDLRRRLETVEALLQAISVTAQAALAEVASLRAELPESEAESPTADGAQPAGDGGDAAVRPPSPPRSRAVEPVRAVPENRRRSGRCYAVVRAAPQGQPGVYWSFQSYADAVRDLSQTWTGRGSVPFHAISQSKRCANVEQAREVLRAALGPTVYIDHFQ